jgi:hypothetical protein
MPSRGTPGANLKNRGTHDKGADEQILCAPAAAWEVIGPLLIEQTDAAMPTR